MAEFKIITDSTTDLTPELITALGVEIIPMHYTIEGKAYADGQGLSPHEFYDKLRAGGASTTAQLNVAQIKSAVRPFLEKGVDVLYLVFSSGLSGTYNSARLCAEDLAEEFPNGKFRIVDTLAASMGEGLLVYHAVQKQKEGKSIDEVAAWVEENKLRLAHWFTVDDLNHLKRGGRVSGAAAFFGTMLNIKPVLHVDDEGHLIPMEKLRGRRQSLDALVNHMEKTAENPAEQVIFVSHGDCEDDARYVADEVKRRFGVKEIHIGYIGTVIGTHSGPGTVALFYLGKGRD